jgi:pimeloyl-ACP methyl ester carboxylesterase
MEIYQEKTLRCDHFDYQAKTWNDSDLAPILALHGWLDNAASFDCIAPLLKNYHVVALDLPGHGLSPHKPKGSRYHYVDFINDIHEVMGYFGWEKIILMGHSMGAGISTLFAGTFPEQVQQLILIEGIGPLVSEPEKSPENLKKAITQYHALNKKKPIEHLTLELAESARKMAGDITMAAVKIMADRGIEKTDSGYIWRSDIQLKSKSPIQFTEHHVTQFLKKIKAKTLAIQGQQSKLNHLIPITKRCLSVENIQVLKLQGGHHVHMENPKNVAESINLFLESTSDSCQ